MKKTLSHSSQYTYRLIAVIVPLVLLLASFAMLSTASLKISARQQHLQDINLKTQAFQEAQSLNQFVINNATSLEKMSLAIPSESTMVGVVQDIEAIVTEYDPLGVVKLSGQNPVRIGQDLVIPILITLHLPPTQLNQLVDQLHGLPYILQLLALDTQMTNDPTLTNINLRLYVQDPFIGY